MMYTVHDTPEVVRRIEGDMAVAVDAVRAADPRLRALVLTGGFARGEGAVRGGKPQNDYDLIALRGIGAMPDYAALRARLELRLGLHIDLAPVAAARLRWTPRSIFWYETALRGRVLWGDADILARIPVRDAKDLHPREALRLLVNRAAGLLFATRQDAAGKRLQASKALLGAMDVALLSEGRFAPTQTERWHMHQERPARGAPGDAWLAWAYAYKTRPDKAPRREGQAAWEAAADAVLDAVPAALEHAGLHALEEYGHQDTWADRVHYLRHVRRIPGARAHAHPTSRVRVATLHMLEACRAGHDPAGAADWLRALVPQDDDPLPLLESLRAATLQ